MPPAPEADPTPTLEGVGPLHAEERVASAEERVAAAVEAALAAHLLGGRRAADIAHVILAGLVVFVFWEITAPWTGLAWLGGFVGTAVLRAANRRRSVRGLGSPAAVRALVRRDVWIAACLWGGWALIHAGADPKNLALLLLIFAGLVAAATSTLVADGRSFYGFTALILGPLYLALLFGEMSRDHVVIVLLVSLFVPFMVTVHRRAHEILLDQLRAGERLKIGEEETARRRDFLNSLVTSAPSPIVLLDDAGAVVQVNPAFERVLGYDAARAVGGRFVELATDSRTRPSLETFLETVQQGRRAVADLPMSRGDGSPLWMRLSGTMARGSAEGTLILVGEDVTEQVEAREAQMLARIQAEEAARAKSAFLASMSHEIRTPMNGILGMIEILLDTPLSDEQRRSAEIIRSSGEGLLRILNDILDFSKIEAGQLDLEEVDFDLHELVAEVARVFMSTATKAGNELVVDLGDAVPRTVRGDPHRLRQILSNLVGNAVKFTRDGEVVVSTSSDGVERGLHRVRFAVRDTGVGIPLGKQEQIFQEFEQADSSTTRIHGGTGLGLSISRRLVELMGGRIGLVSVPGEGSEFSFTLVLPAADGRGDDARRPPAVPLAGHRFLVVDDNATARRIVVEGLARVGAVAVEAEGVDEALRLVRDAEAGDAPLEVVILDHMMPERDGFDFAEAVQGDPGLTPMRILMVTSAALPGGSERARAVGIAGYLAKPVSRAELLRALGALLGRPVAGGPARRLVTRATIARTEGRARVLLAEDNLVNQQVAQALLRKRGCEVVGVANGREAVEAVRSERFDIVLMDIQMPEMDGLEATRRIRRFLGPDELPVIALTAHAFAEERERARAAGMNDFLAKPFKPGDLGEMVDRWVPATGDADERSSKEARMDGPTDAVPPVDLEGFRALMREAGIEDVVDTTVAIYRTEAPAIFADLDKAMTGGDADGIRRLAHSLKSASGNIRAGRLAVLLEAMERLGTAGDLTGVRAAYPELRSEFDAVMTYLGSGG